MQTNEMDCPDCERPLMEFDVGSGVWHCSNPDCKFQFFDTRNGKKYRK
ncbi:MAG: hypothetical protein ACRDFB_07015 [Rhabdochlamydiaceae bacterium]